MIQICPVSASSATLTTMALASGERVRASSRAAVKAVVAKSVVTDAARHDA